MKLCEVTFRFIGSCFKILDYLNNSITTAGTSLLLFVCNTHIYTHTHTNSQSSTRLFVSLCLSLFHSTEMIYLASPLSSSSPRLPSGSVPSSITLSPFLIPTLETPMPVQENNRLKTQPEPRVSPHFLSLYLCLPLSSQQISGKINLGEAKLELRGQSPTQG